MERRFLSTPTGSSQGMGGADAAIDAGRTPFLVELTAQLSGTGTAADPAGYIGRQVDVNANGARFVVPNGIQLTAADQGYPLVGRPVVVDGSPKPLAWCTRALHAGGRRWTLVPIDLGDATFGEASNPGNITITASGGGGPLQTMLTITLPSPGVYILVHTFRGVGGTFLTTLDDYFNGSGETDIQYLLRPWLVQITVDGVLAADVHAPSSWADQMQVPNPPANVDPRFTGNGTAIGFARVGDTAAREVKCLAAHPYVSNAHNIFDTAIGRSHLRWLKLGGYGSGAGPGGSGDFLTVEALPGALDGLSGINGTFP